MKLNAYINGEFVTKDDVVEIMNVNTNKVLGTVPALKNNDIDYAFESAHKAFTCWKFSPIKDRIKALNEFKDLLLKNKSEIAHIMMDEIGKTFKDSSSEIDRTAEYIVETIKEFQSLKTEKIDSSVHNVKNKVAYITREPLGVVLAISPFNYPVNLSLSKIAPAILMGNSVVFKAATQGCLTGAKIAELFDKTSLPKGVFNNVTGRGRDIGDTIVTNKNVSMISFTGSAKVGNNIANLTSKIPLVLELGGKDACIIWNYDNYDFVADQIIKGAYSFSGQRCTAIKRVLTTNEIADKLAPILANKVKKLTIGLSTEDVNITPLIDQWTTDNMIELKKDALKKGAKILVDSDNKNNLIGPILLDNVSLDSKLAWEEPFAPILPIIRLNTLDEIIKVHNDSEYGLQSSIFINSNEEGIEIAKKLETGTVNINRASSRGPDILPFIGIKNSGFGVQGIKDALLSMSRVKPIITND